MFRAPRACLLLLGLAMLGSCARQTDAFQPRIIITEPAAGSVSRQNSTVVRGYAMDDRAIAQIRVNGQPLTLREGSRKIVPFAFRTSTTSNRADYSIEAVDEGGLSTKIALPLRYDPNPPKLEITKFEREGETLRVSGVATDDVKVTSISVDGSKLGLGASRRVPFFAESTGKFMDIVVTDAAGNKVSRRVQ
ncbi:hypothetical protein [Deinococcus peraridilitoris]|uniref:Lipoprotein n=1 Tax=Deinococcus peraridilitoris (strain DSM 19664 / LMG 22246 / CIP 109416 / KR-200) TaxID=937777 RepID=K9ZZ42_DEIPD|nr:hypothetical protein [Deinococcus peraridilitoris]AFZ66025.1 hypothetical protein Deipe_0427 [Deinococcus peraridilitoris DSM 19664]